MDVDMMKAFIYSCFRNFVGNVRTSVAEKKFFVVGCSRFSAISPVTYDPVNWCNSVK